MGKVKRLWENKIDAIEESYYNDDILYEEAFKSLCLLGYGPGLASDVLDAIKEMKESN